MASSVFCWFLGIGAAFAFCWGFLILPGFSRHLIHGEGLACTRPRGTSSLIFAAEASANFPEREHPTRLASASPVTSAQSLRCFIEFSMGERDFTTPAVLSEFHRLQTDTCPEQTPPAQIPFQPASHCGIVLDVTAQLLRRHCPPVTILFTSAHHDPGFNLVIADAIFFHRKTVQELE